MMFAFPNYSISKKSVLNWNTSFKASLGAGYWLKPPPTSYAVQQLLLRTQNGFR